MLFTSLPMPPISSKMLMQLLIFVPKLEVGYNCILEQFEGIGGGGLAKESTGSLHCVVSSSKPL